MASPQCCASRSWRLGLAVALLLLLLVPLAPVAVPAGLQRIGDVLVLRQPPEAADAVIVLGGGIWTRLPQGIALVRAGYAPTLFLLEDLVCTTPSEAQVGDPCRRLSAARSLGEPTPLDALLPPDAVVLLLPDLPNGAAGTAEEASVAWERLRARRVRRLLLVTDEYHSRRASLVWRRAVAGEAAVISVPSTDRAAPVDGWWRTPGGRKAITSEYLKLLVYALQRRI